MYIGVPAVCLRTACVLIFDHIEIISADIFADGVFNNNVWVLCLSNLQPLNSLFQVSLIHIFHERAFT